MSISADQRIGAAGALNAQCTRALVSAVTAMPMPDWVVQSLVPGEDSCVR